MKKPIYKRKWFIAVVVVVLLGIIGSAMGGNAEKDTKDNTTQQPSVEAQKGDSEEDIKKAEIKEEPKEETKKEEEEKEIGYKAGTYKVGVDIASGEYLLLSEDQTFGAYFEINKDSKGELDSIIANDNFFTTSYITINDGEYLKLQSCKAISVSEVGPIQPIEGKYIQGMYKVGTDIAPGEYKVIMEEDSIMGFGYYEVTSDSRHTLDSIISNDNFENNAYITLEKGRYLKLNEAYIEVK